MNQSRPGGIRWSNASSDGLILTFDDPVDVESIELSATRRVAVTD